jgi:hypothetical protein
MGTTATMIYFRNPRPVLVACLFMCGTILIACNQYTGTVDSIYQSLTHPPDSVVIAAVSRDAGSPQCAKGTRKVMVLASMKSFADLLQHYDFQLNEGWSRTDYSPETTDWTREGGGDLDVIILSKDSREVSSYIEPEVLQKAQKLAKPLVFLQIISRPKCRELTMGK